MKNNGFVSGNQNVHDVYVEVFVIKFIAGLKTVFHLNVLMKNLSFL